MISLSPERIVGVRFQRSGRVHYYDGGDLELQVNDPVVVEAEGGSRVGWVAIGPGQLLHSDLKGPLPRVLRKATLEEAAGARPRPSPGP